jgi:hypothetical protein
MSRLDELVKKRLDLATLEDPAAFMTDLEGIVSAMEDHQGAKRSQVPDSEVLQIVTDLSKHYSKAAAAAPVPAADVAVRRVEQLVGQTLDLAMLADPDAFLVDLKQIVQGVEAQGSAVKDRELVQIISDLSRHYKKAAAGAAIAPVDDRREPLISEGSATPGRFAVPNPASDPAAANAANDGPDTGLLPRLATIGVLFPPDDKLHELLVILDGDQILLGDGYMHRVKLTVDCAKLFAKDLLEVLGRLLLPDRNSHWTEGSFVADLILDEGTTIAQVNSEDGGYVARVWSDGLDWPIVGNFETMAAAQAACARKLGEPGVTDKIREHVAERAKDLEGYFADEIKAPKAPAE